jgi:hypothetical protein
MFIHLFIKIVELIYGISIWNMEYQQSVVRKITS